ncbi:hypothetical protein GCM10029963_78970 [Micromonospora andamanensis]
MDGPAETETEDEPVRGASPEALADVPAEPVRGADSRGDGPEQLLLDFGEQAAQQIEELARNLAGPDPAGEGYLDKLGRLNQARMAAEEQVLPELILIDPETNEISPASTQSPAAEPRTDPEDWIPMVEDPTDPRWQEIAEQEAAMNDDSQPPTRS